MKIFLFQENEYICGLLYDSLKHSLVAHTLGVSIVLFFFREVVSFKLLIFISIAFVFVTVFRVTALWLYLKRDTHTQNTKHWYKIFLLSLLSASLIWAVMIVFLFPEQLSPYQLLIIAVPMGFVAGSIMTLSADKLSVLVFSQPIVFAIIARLYYTDEATYHALASLLVVLDIPIFASALASSEASFRLHQSALLERQMNAAKTDFLAKMTHELRTPMNAVIGISHLLSKTTLSSQQKKHLYTLQKASNSLLRTINSILDFSRIEAKQMELEVIPFNLHNVVDTVIAHIESQTKDKQLYFDVRVAENVAPFLMGDPLRLSQVLTNLSANGVKFTHEGGVTLNVSQLNSDKQRANLKFEVIDTGIGIKEQDKKKLFESFTQLQTSDSRKYGGTGLGLAISQSLLALMDSQMEIESTPNTGSTFSFTIWFDIATKDSVEASNYLETDITAHLDVVPELVGKRILLVDDDKLNLNVAKEILSNFGLTVRVAKSASEALRQLDAFIPELIFMDLQMPEMTGYEAFTLIRKNPAWQHIPIIALTANASTTEKKKVLKHGMNAFLTKPLMPRQLKHTLLKWMPYESNKETQLDKTPNPFERIKKELNSNVEVEEKLKIMIDELGREFSMTLFSSMADVIEKEGDELMRLLQRQKINEAGALAHRLKGALSFCISSKLENLLADIEENSIDRNEGHLMLQTELDLMKKLVKVASQLP